MKMGGCHLSLCFLILKSTNASFSNRSCNSRKIPLLCAPILCMAVEPRWENLDFMGGGLKGGVSWNLVFPIQTLISSRHWGSTSTALLVGPKVDIYSVSNVLRASNVMPVNKVTCWLHIQMVNRNRGWTELWKSPWERLETGWKMSNAVSVKKKTDFFKSIQSLWHFFSLLFLGSLSI